MTARDERALMAIEEALFNWLDHSGDCSFLKEDTGLECDCGLRNRLRRILSELHIHISDDSERLVSLAHAKVRALERDGFGNLAEVMNLLAEAEREIRCSHD